MSEYHRAIKEAKLARLDPSQGRWIPARADWRTRLAAALRRLFRRAGA